MKTIFVVFFILFLNNVLLSQWIVQSSGTNNQLQSVFFPSENIGFTIGATGTILKTNNGGINWNIQSSNITDFLYSVFFINANTGWISADNGKTLKTNNGGNNWTLIQSPVNISLYSVYFLNEITGWISGNSGTVIKTTNGGINWIQLNTNSLASGLYFIRFNDINTGWSVGYGANSIIKTTNGGLNWFSQLNGGNGRLASLYLNDINVLLTTGDGGNVFKTTNSGNNWIQYNTGVSSILNSIYFTNSNTGWVSGYDGKILKSTNGGINWIQQYSVPSQLLISTHMVNSFVGWTVGLNGLILKTTNGGTVFISRIDEEIPEIFYLYNNYPNPFNPFTNIRFNVSKTNDVILKVFDVTGKEISTLIDDKFNPGTYETQWNGNEYPSGVYFYRLITEGFSETKKMILLK